MPRGTSAQVYASVTTDTTNPIVITVQHATIPASLAPGLLQVNAHNAIAQPRFIEASTDHPVPVALDTMITVPPTA